jgi:hypothetical protein
VILFPGDAAILIALFTHRSLTSGQLARRLRRSAQVIRRAIRRRLRPGGFVVSIQRQQTEEAAYTLGPEGLAFMAHELGCAVSDVPFPRKATTTRGFFWKHGVLVNDVHIAFDLAAEAHASPIQIHRTIHEWETKSCARRNAPHHEVFVLSERLKGPDGVVHVHRPDCLFLMRPKAADAQQRVAVFLEADRNTEAMRRIRAKLAAYFLYWSRRRFFDAFEAIAMRVLFVLDDVTDRRRIHSMQDELRQFATQVGAEPFRRCFRFARKHDLDETTVLAQPIWWDADDQPRLFFQPVHRQPPREQRAEVAA